MTFGEILDNTLDDLNLHPASAGVTETVTRIKRWINEAHRALLRDPQTADLRNGTLTFTTVPSEASYALPQAFERLLSIVQPDQNTRLLYQTLNLETSIDPGHRSLGTPSHWSPEGYWPVMRQPNGTGLWVSTGDNQLEVHLVGVRTDGDQRTFYDVVPGPTTGRVQLGTNTDWTRVLSWSVKKYADPSEASLYDAPTGGRLLGRIPSLATGVRYQVIRLWPTPTAALPYTVAGEFQIPNMMFDEDEPMLPPSFHDMLGVYARMRLYKKEGDTTRASYEENDWITWQGKLRSFVQFPPDYHPVAGQHASGHGWSDLGPGYPADRWMRP